MDNLVLAKQFLKEIGMPNAQQNGMSGRTFLALANIKPGDEWKSATNAWLRVHEISQFSKEHYQKGYAENTRESIRKHCLQPFREAALVEDNGKPAAHPQYRYRIAEEALALVRQYNSPSWKMALEEFKAKHPTLKEKYARKRAMAMMPVFINGGKLKFSPGEHNELQKAVLEEFAPRFLPGSECLYVGDSTKKGLVKNDAKIAELGFAITLHDKMPDVVIYVPTKNCLYFIEAVTSVGPMSPQRVVEIENMTKDVAAAKRYVTAFPDFKTYRKFCAKIAWQTEVWIAAEPDHRIRLD